MYNINNFDIKEAIESVNSAMTVKGQIIGYSFMYSGKNIENRNRKIKDGWYALHIGGSKQLVPKHHYIYGLLSSFKKEDLPPRSSIVGVFKINGVDNNKNNPWYIGPIGNKVTKFIKFKTPIINLPGHQSVTYNLKTIDKKLYKRNGKNEIPIKNQVIEKLKNLVQTS